MRGFEGAYMLMNPIDPIVLHRYESDKIARADNHRVNDKEVTARRAIYIDHDVIRPKGISATDTEIEAAREVVDRVQEFLIKRVGPNAVARGCSGNGFFLLIALEPRPVNADETARIAKFLELLQKKFGTDRVKIDEAVFNPARLMPAAGTMKCKGANTRERPWRRTSFCCRPNIERVPLGVIC